LPSSKRKPDKNNALKSKYLIFQIFPLPHSLNQVIIGAGVESDNIRRKAEGYFRLQAINQMLYFDPSILRYNDGG